MSKNYRIVLEIEMNGDTAKEAAKSVQDMLQERGNLWMFYVQEENKREVIGVDFETDEVKVIENYKPLITQWQVGSTTIIKK